VLKKNGKLCIVHDLQPLNKVSIRDAGMLPIVDDFVEGFAGRQCYTVFDLYWGFDARKMDPESRDMTAFMTPLGLLRITSMPTGYTNSPAEFQKCMVFILHDEIPHIANIFIDDLPIKGPKSRYPEKDGRSAVLYENPGIRKFIWEHAQDVHRIMHKVGSSGATFSALKVQCCRQTALIVGQTCSPQGRIPDSKKVSAILDWPPLTTPQEVRRFLGLCGTVRIWIKNYSAIIRPLTELYRQNQDFLWNPRRVQAFSLIKNLVANAPALRPIDYESEEPVILSVDSSKEAAGMILAQNDEEGRRRPARYGSVPMSERESRYSQPKLELFGLYRALRHWRLYIIGAKKLIVEVDAKYIQGLLNNPDLQPDAAVNRWIQGILLFHFALIHVPATRFQGPDALSRRGKAEHEEAESDDDSWLDDVALFMEISSKLEKLPYDAQTLPSCMLSRTGQERQLKDIHKFLSTLEAPVFPNSRTHRRFIQQATRYMIHEGKFMRRNGKRNPLVVVMEPINRLKILTKCHEELGHPGIQSMWDALKIRFYWPKLHNDVEHHVASCHKCQVRSTKKMEISPTISAPVTLFQTVYIDIMMMPEVRGLRMIVAARDDLSGTCEAKALATKTAEDLATFFWENIYCRYGCPRKVITDNGPEVKAGFRRLMKRMGVPHVRISPYNKHANGVVEQGHYTLREAIVKSCGGNIDLWPEKLAIALLADRVTVSRVTGFSAYQLLHGTDPVLPFDLTEATFLVTGFRSGMTTEELLTLRIRQLSKHERDITKAIETLRKSRFRSKQHFEKRFWKKLQKEEYKKGELVLVRNVGLETEVGTGKKTEDRYFGPYEVDRKNHGGAYILKELDGTVFRNNPTAAFRLLPYITRHHWFMRHGWLNEEEDSDSDDTDEELFESSEED
jgi:transposase InsO family protein